VRLKYLIEGEDSENEEIADATPAILPESSSSSVEVFDAAEKLYEETYNSFYLFVEKIFSLAIKEKYTTYVGGEYVKKSCDFLQNNKRTMYCGGRGTFKSLRYYCYIAWLVWRNKKDKKNIDIAYISYNQDLAAAHIGKMKELINKSFFMSEGLYDEYSTATSKAEYMWPIAGKEKTEISHINVNSFGIMGGLRGPHPNIVLIDDFYVDEMKQNVVSLEPELVKKINLIFRKVVLPMPMPGGQLHVIGTPQSFSDLWYQKEFYKTDGDRDDTLKFNVRIEPSYTNWSWEGKCFIEGEEKKALWPEMFSLEYLEEQESLLGRQEFAQEYLATPRSSSDSFFDEERVNESIRLGHDNGLMNYANKFGFRPFKADDWFGYKIFGAYDPAKSRDPAHFVVFAYNNGILIQLLSMWMDSWNYSISSNGKPSQFEYIQNAVKHFGIQRVWGDNTNHVLESVIEEHKISGLIGTVITHSLKGRMAVALQSYIGKPSLLLLDDERQKRALLAIQNDRLKAAHSKDNHGESFTTIGFIVVNVLNVGSKNTGRRITVKTEKDKIPKMYKGFFFDRTSSFGSNRRDLSSMQNPRNLRNLGRMM